MAIDVDPERAIVGSALTRALTEAGEGGGRLVLLLGEAGIGKTTVARHLAARARRSGVTVRWSACWSGGSTVAHAPWLTLLSGLGSSARHAVDALLGSQLGDPGSGAAARLSAYGAVVGALEEATLDRPALLVVDDLHWADGGTVQLLDYVAAHLPGLPVLVVGTYRDTDVAPGSPLTRLGGGADRMSLRGLDLAGVAALLGDQLGAVRAAELADQVVGLTGGNPFLVVQVGRLLKEDTAALRVATLPVGARDLLQQRLGSLADEDRRVVVGAGVLGSPFRAIELAQMLDMAPPAIIEVLDRAAGLRIVERAPGVGVWAFAHDLFRQSALRGTSPGEIAALHRSAAAVLQEAQAEPAVIASHLQAAGDDVADEAAAWSVRAGVRALAAMAWEDAAGHYERALTALPGGGNHDIRADALAGLGRARLLAGDEQGAARVFDELAALARSLGSAELLARAALGFSADRSGFEIRLFDQRQIDLLYEAAHALADRGPRLRSPVLARLSVALSLTAADTRRLTLAEAAVTLAREAGEPAILARALAAHCDAISGPAHVERRLAEASEIIAIAEAEGDGPLELLGRRLRFVARLERGDLAGVEEDATSFARRAESVGNPLYSWYVPLWRAQFAIVAGDIERAERLIAHAQALSQAANSLNGPTLSMVLRLVACWHLGDFVAAIGIIESITEAAPELAQHVSATGTLAWTNLLAGRTPVAAAALDRVAALGLSEQTPDAEWLPNMTNLVRTAAALQHPVLAEMVALLEPHAALVPLKASEPVSTDRSRASLPSGAQRSAATTTPHATPNKLSP